MKIVTQEGDPVTDKVDPEEFTVPKITPEDDIREIANDIRKGLKRFRNNTIFKVGLVVVALRVVNVAGAIIIENQRLKAKQNENKPQDEEK